MSRTFMLRLNMEPSVDDITILAGKNLQMLVVFATRVCVLVALERHNQPLYAVMSSFSKR